jgi:hypothetical protein
MVFKSTGSVRLLHDLGHGIDGKQEGFGTGGGRVPTVPYLQMN